MEAPLLNSTRLTRAPLPARLSLRAITPAISQSMTSPPSRLPLKSSPTSSSAVPLPLQSSSPPEVLPDVSTT
jgi:hypothetical protein